MSWQSCPHKFNATNKIIFFHKCLNQRRPNSTLCAKSQNCAAKRSSVGSRQGCALPEERCSGGPDLISHCKTVFGRHRSRQLQHCFVVGVRNSSKGGLVGVCHVAFVRTSLSFAAVVGRAILLQTPSVEAMTAPQSLAQVILEGLPAKSAHLLQLLLLMA